MWSTNCHFLPERGVCSLSKQVCAGGAAARHIPAPGVMTLQRADPLHNAAQRAGLSEILPVLTSTYLEKRLHYEACALAFHSCYNSLSMRNDELFPPFLVQWYVNKAQIVQPIYELYNQQIFAWKTSYITFEEIVQSDREHEMISQSLLLTVFL